MISILQAALHTSEDQQYWTCWVQITQNEQAWMLPATAPGLLSREELQAHFEAREAELWNVAIEKERKVDIFEGVPHRALLKAFTLVVLDEINILRQTAGLSQRTASQIVSAIVSKL